MNWFRSGCRWMAYACLLLGPAWAAQASPATAATAAADMPTVRYAGSVSCNDCPVSSRSIPATLDLFADGTYTLHVDRRATGSAGGDEVGRWRRSPVGDRLSLIFGDRTEPRRFLQQPDGTLTDADPVDGAASRLRETTGLTGLEPRLRLRGEWSGPLDAPIYTDCRSGQVLSVKRSPALQALSGAVRQARATASLDPTAPVVITGDGRFTRPPGLPKAARAAVLVIDRFDNVWPGERCEVADAVAPLLETYWKLTRLGSRAVVSGDAARAAHVVLLPAPPPSVRADAPEGPDGKNPGLLPNPFKPPSRDPSVTGSTGCNRLTGRYRLSGEQLIFAPALGTTRMACPPGDAQRDEQAFGEALQQTVRHRLFGQHLELYGEGGKLLARFEAQR